ncbi:DBH-like monooxygenase protein 1 homolog isoform X2 [Myxocyprinus asiaticus]|uniref:DBH-like monooxygenase protein 1 homolog isoform X2 n=1 Tax=Myxocyprinus asiaticus TaxID=70543 RepID=UPI002222B960|nr:DBH-like monooxygenase protein 1 homolog isoform X2 [Myxocyprinus asiaticus]
MPLVLFSIKFYTSHDMSENKLLCAVVFLTSLVCLARSQGTGFVHSATLDADGRYNIKWGFDESTITFEAEVETKGYIGFGLSPNGAMASSDIVIGGVLNGNPYLVDYFTDSNREVQRDPQQSYRLLYGRENDTHTVLAFSRNLQTCDDNDKGSTVRVIWAFHAEDVGVSGPVYHGMNRGRKSVRLLNPGTSSSIPAGTAFFDLQNEKVPVPQKDTTYWCQIFKFPELKRKHHVIRIEPLIQKGHENLVHHILLYQCDSNLNKSEINWGHECYHPNMPDSFFTCETVVFAWAIGGEGFTYPPHVGMSIGTSIDPVYVQMEIHFDNPSLQRGIVDSSGLRLYYSPSLRRYDAGVIETGVWVSLYHMLPPGMQDYITEGHCTQECLQESLDSEMPSGVNVFAVLLHAHLAGRGIRTRHFRQHVELHPLASDDQFDFNFQEFQPLSQERLILPGDSLITECRYNTRGRINMTWGGLSTRDEMCLSYLLYYPRVNLARCESLPEISGQLKFIGVREIQEPVTTWPFVIKSPKKYSNLSFTEAMDKYRWTRKRGKAFNDVVRKLPMNVRCSKMGQDEWSIQGMIVSSPELKSEQASAAVVACRNNSQTQCEGSLSLLLTVCLLLILQTYLHMSTVISMSYIPVHTYHMSPLAPTIPNYCH